MTNRTPGTATAALVSIPRMRARAYVEGDELHVQDVLEVDVGDVLLPAGDPLEPADARWRLADRHWGASSASGIDDRSPMSGVAARVGPPGAAAAAASTASKICS